jgi:murein DD-endopeptidase MepM/ murein hydrolase activator NlpD
MSCCPKVDPAAVIGGAFNDSLGPESDIHKGESVPCYMSRGGNTSGLHDDANADAPDKIDNTTIPIKKSGTSVSVGTDGTGVTFKLTSTSTKTAVSWSIDATPPGLSFNTSTGVLTGTFTTLNTTYNITISAYDSTAHDDSHLIDSRAFSVTPTLQKDGDIKLKSPLPGGIINSKFGPRMHPIQGVMKPHTGIDMKYADRSVKDVVAAADGEVILQGGNPESGYGYRIWLKHTDGSGAHVCTTTYNHLAKIYVKDGQKVMCGQAIGLEGSTGASTGNHLHFEVKLPDGKFIDPEPLINGEVTVVTANDSTGTATAQETRTVSGASLSKAEADGTMSSCAQFGSSYPAPSTPNGTGVPPGGSSDPFELAWYFTMKHEVGSWWSVNPGETPSDNDIAVGAIDTRDQRKKVGYVNLSNDPGGETKFGVAQRPNPNIVVKTIQYSPAKTTGYQNFWQSAKSPCGDKSKLVSIMLFDMNYMHGAGNAKTIYSRAGISSSTSDSQEKQLADVQALYEARLAFIKAIPRPEFQRGWQARAAECLAYVKSL